MKWLMVAAVILIVGFLVWRFLLPHQTPVAKNQTAPQNIATAPKSGVASNSLQSKTDTSDPALDQDFADVQNSLNKLDKDQISANADTSSQETPPAQ
jgi:cytoskeletal protein RodZ